MKSTQNERILQIKNETLVVGVDVAKNWHYARAFNNRGVELGKLLRFQNSAQGFVLFDAWVQEIQQKHGMTEAIVGFEPTGHYWFNLGDHLEARGHKLAILNPYHVKCARELDDNTPSKSDQKDPWLENGTSWEIALPEETEIVKFGGFVEVKEGNGRLIYEHKGYQSVRAVPYEMPILGYQSDVVNSLRLWAARATKHLDMSLFGQGKYLDALRGIPSVTTPTYTRFV
jgi:hypothetical protein